MGRRGSVFTNFTGPHILRYEIEFNHNLRPNRFISPSPSSTCGVFPSTTLPRRGGLQLFGFFRPDLILYAICIIALMNTRFIAAVAILAMVMTAVPYVCADESDTDAASKPSYVYLHFYADKEAYSNGNEICSDLYGGLVIGPYVSKMPDMGEDFKGWRVVESGKFYPGNWIIGKDVRTLPGYAESDSDYAHLHLIAEYNEQPASQNGNAETVYKILAVLAVIAVIIVAVYFLAFGRRP